MKNIKQFFTYLVVGALVIALSVSCKSNEEPEKELVEIPSQYYGVGYITITILNRHLSFVLEF